jgi:hypothetical protein
MSSCSTNSPGRRQSLLYFPKKPLVIIHEPLDRFLHQRLYVAASAGGQFGL